MSKPPILLIHGFWVTPRSWEHWVTHFEKKGHQVIAPAYPGFEVEVEALNRDPSPIAAMRIPAIIERMESEIAKLDSPPIIMGHSAGGAWTQLLLDRGHGLAGVAICSAPTEGVLIAPLSQLKSTFPVFRNPANIHRAVGLSFEEWQYAFTNAFTEAEGRALYERYHIPASGNIVWNSVLANLIPGKQDAAVDYKDPNRRPLLFISAELDHIMPPAVQRSNANHYDKKLITEVKEFAGYSHLLPAQKGWEAIADYALDWAMRHSAMPAAARAH